MKILLLGHDGQIGWELDRRLSVKGSVRGLSYPDIDYSQIDDVLKIVRDESPDIVINAAAYTAVDKAETDVDLAKVINAEAPGRIAEEAEKLGAVFVHYSTDFVFDGKKGVPYIEEDIPNPLSVYGETKLAGDRAVLAVGGRSFVFRVSWIYGLRGSNFLLTMRRLAGERDELGVVDDQVGCPTWCGSVAEGTAGVLDKVLAGDEDHFGLYNMVCGGETSWCGFAKEILGDSVTVNPITTEEYPTPAVRPAYSGLDCTKLKETFGIELPNWRVALMECLRR
jgi:dTDP-4-dehydrorhamnose reductase